MNRLLLLIIICCSSAHLCAQESSIHSQLEGYWTGTFIRHGNSTQAFTLDIHPLGDSLEVSFKITDWIYYKPVNSTLRVKGKSVSFESYYGVVKVVWDSLYAEMVGECNFAKVHIKRALRPPRREIEYMAGDVNLGDISIAVRITKPVGEGPWPTMIIVHGRGCGSKNDWDARPEVLSQYGLAVVTFDKRGHSNTNFPCEKTTMDMHAQDLATLTDQIASLDYTGPIGYLAYSAGGWVAPKAAAQTKTTVDFIVSLVGPSTSVKQQQLDCSVYYLRDQLGLNDQAIKEALAYTELSFAQGNPNEIYESMVALLDSARAHAWIDVLEQDDIPVSAEKLDEIWVRRNDYDPSDDLKAFKGPFLSILGGDDFVVPYRENSSYLKQLFKEVDKINYRIAIVPSANHGLEHGHRMRDLGFYSDLRKCYSYFKYDRVAAGAFDDIIVFLREYEFIE